jgi:hypothetical protein
MAHGHTVFRRQPFWLVALSELVKEGRPAFFSGIPGLRLDPIPVRQGSLTPLQRTGR